MYVRSLDYLYILFTILFTVYGQIIIKWRIAQLGDFPLNQVEKIKHIILLLFDPVVFSGIFAAFLASLAWISAMSKFELSYAYPFMSLNFAIVLILSSLILSEPINFYKVLGVMFIIFGTLLASKA